MPDSKMGISRQLKDCRWAASFSYCSWLHGGWKIKKTKSRWANAGPIPAVQQEIHSLSKCLQTAYSVSHSTKHRKPKNRWDTFFVPKKLCAECSLLLLEQLDLKLKQELLITQSAESHLQNSASVDLGLLPRNLPLSQAPRWCRSYRSQEHTSKMPVRVFESWLFQDPGEILSDNSHYFQKRSSKP